MTEIARYNFFFRTNQASYAPLNTTTGLPLTNAMTFSIGTPALTVQKPSNYFTARILNVALPFSLNMVNNTNNTCYHNSITVTSGTYNFDMILGIGNYSISEYCAAIQTLLNAEVQAVSPGSTAAFQVYQDPDYEGTTTISCSLGSESVLSLTMNFGYYAPFASVNVGNSYLGNMLGFPLAITVTPSTPQISPNHFNVALPSCLVLRSQALIATNYEFMGSVTASGYGTQVQSSIVAIFNINTSFDSWLNSTNLVPVLNRIKNNQINSIDFTFTTDDSLIPVDFRGLAGSIALEIVEYQTEEPPQQGEILTRDGMRQRLEGKIGHHTQSLASLESGTGTNLQEGEDSTEDIEDAILHLKNALEAIEIIQGVEHEQFETPTGTNAGGTYVDDNNQ